MNADYFWAQMEGFRVLPRPLSDDDQEEVDRLLYDAIVHHTPAEVTAAIAAGARPLALVFDFMLGFPKRVVHLSQLRPCHPAFEQGLGALHHQGRGF